MSKYIQNLKGPIENALLFLGLVLFSLGFFTLYSAIPQVIGNSYFGWSSIISAVLLLSIGFTLAYIGYKSSKIKME